jgi:hypothetical protein
VSPAIVIRKRTPSDGQRERVKEPGERGVMRDWIWVGIAAACTWLLLTGLHRLFSGPPSVLPPSVAPAESPASESGVSLPGPVATWTPSLEHLAPVLPPRTIMMRDEAVRVTVESLRQHARECPDAPDALSEEEIKDIERQRALIL